MDLQLCQHIKASIETSHVPVVLLIALSNAENIVTGLDKGADAYITKPYTPSVLLKQVENILLQRKRIHKQFAKQWSEQEDLNQFEFEMSVRFQTIF